MLQAGRNPDFRLSPVVEPWSAITKIRAAAPFAKSAPLRQSLADLPSPMDNLKQTQKSLRTAASLSGQSDAGDFAAGVYLETKGLKAAVLCVSVYNADAKGRNAVDSRSPAQKQKPCSFLGAWHKRLASFVQNENCHFYYSKSNPYGFLLRFAGVLPLCLPSGMLQTGGYASTRFVLTPSVSAAEASRGQS